MAVITLKVVVSNLEDVRAQFDQIKVHRSITGEVGPYSEITGPGTRLALEEGKIIYEFVDTTGDQTYYYRSSYFNSTSALESSLSDPQQGEGGAALDICSVEELKTNYLFGLDLTDDTGEPYPDSLYEFFIEAAVSRLEHRLDLPIIPKSVTDERHNYFREDYDKYIWLETKLFPIIDVSEVKLVLPGEQVVQNFESEWFNIEKEAGQIELVPGTGTAGSILLGASASWIPLIYANNRYVPHVFRISYTAGFESGSVPPVIKESIGKIAAFGPLNIAGDLLGGAGIASQSIGIDGLSTSFNTTSSSTSSGFGARLIQYEKELKETIPMLERYYKGIRLKII
jgi:hypothetical protein